MTIENEDLNTDGLWCVVANIKRDHPFGPVGVESKSGTRQFRGGTKVYIAGCYHGMCESVVAIGLHRHTLKFITCVVDVQNVDGFRAKVAYHPKVAELIKADDRCWIRTKEQVEMWAAEFPEWQRLYGRKSGISERRISDNSLKLVVHYISLTIC